MPQEIKSAKDIQNSIFDLITSWAENRSKDPRTKVGACVYDPVTGGVYLGYNGFPKGVADWADRWDRPAKYSFVIHAEVNAIIKALQALGADVARCSLHITHQPCSGCMQMILQTGIKEVYYRNAKPDAISELMAKEARIRCWRVDEAGNVFHPEEKQ